METNNNKKTASKTTAERPVQMVRRGAIAASIWQRQTQTGFAYYEFTLSRSWKSKSGEREGYSQSFFTRNAADLATVVEGASQWITEQELAAIVTTPESATQAAA